MKSSSTTINSSSSTVTTTIANNESSKNRNNQSSKSVTTAPTGTTSKRTGSSTNETSTTTTTTFIITYLLSAQQLVLAWFGSLLVWPAMLLLPLLLTIQFSPLHYSKVFPIEWYDENDDNDDNNTTATRRKPLGLILGILTVAIGQVGVCIFFYFYKYGYISTSSSSSSMIHNNDSNAKNYISGAASSSSSFSTTEPTSIQTKGAVKYDFVEGILTHLSQPEGFVVLAAYLAITWMFNLLPNSYYQFHNVGSNNNNNISSNYGTIQLKELFLCLVIQDAIQYIMHRLEHDASPTFYQTSHKPHHKFLNPRLFDAFNGSLTDTVCMIIIPLYITANIVRTTNVWTYMAFGSTYACWLTLIHSEYAFVWDPYFRYFGFGTPADHHVHHAFFKYNYGHLFMWFDRIAGTYHNPKLYTPKNFNVGV